jgi:hypothetical protein
VYHKLPRSRYQLVVRVMNVAMLDICDYRWGVCDGRDYQFGCAGAEGDGWAEGEVKVKVKVICEYI